MNLNIVPTLNCNIDYLKNTVYCSTFQLAWNKLITIIGEKVALKGDTDLKHLVDSLDAMEFIESDIDSSCHLSLCGWVQENIIDEIKRQLKEKFNYKSTLLDNLSKGNDSFVAYSFLKKILEFILPFENIDNGLYIPDFECYVESFGIKKVDNEEHKDLIDNVTVFSDYYPDKYAVKLSLKSEIDELFLVKLDKRIGSKEDMALGMPLNLKVLLEESNIILSSSTSKLKHKDSLIIPEISFTSSHIFTELIDRDFLNKGFENYFISDAIQVIEFNMNETGVKVLSEAVICLKCTCSSMCSSNSYIFRPPFLLVLRNKISKKPYLVLWVVDNSLFKAVTR